MKTLDVGKGVLKTVSSKELEGWTRDGWVVVGTIEEEILTAVMDTVPKPPPPPNSGVYYNPLDTISCSRGVVQKITMFVLKQDEQSALAIIQNQLKQAQSENFASQQLVKKVEADLKEVRTQQDASDKALQDSKKRSGDFESGLQTANTLLRKLQQERGFFEKALGVIGVQQILKGETFTGELVVSPEKPAPEPSDRFSRVE